MFAESLIETSWAQRSRRSWTTLTSFGIQAIAIGVLLMIPLLSNVVLPAVRTVTTPISIGRRDPGPPPPQPTHGFHSNVVEIVPNVHQIMMPGYIPRGIPQGPDPGPVGPAVGDPTIDIGLPFNPTAGPSLPFRGARQMIPLHPTVSVKPLRISNMLPGSLIHRVEPGYPPLAKAARVQGPVVLEAVISKTGTIENLQLISGHPMLAPAAIDAVRQWRYKPYILNGEAIEVETQITVNFTLQN
jgi:protein TonB